MLKDLISKIKKNFEDPTKNIKFKDVVSYTTRDIRDYEINGKEHFFVTAEEADKILSEEIICARTTIGDVKYFVTKEEIEKPENNLYIIDPLGIKYLLNHWHNIRRFIILYIKANEKLRYERAKNRPGYKEEVYKERVSAENEQFTEFEERTLNTFDDVLEWVECYTIYNNSNTIDQALKEAKKIIASTYTPETMYLVVGRTCSGKDTLCNSLIKGSNN